MSLINKWVMAKAALEEAKQEELRLRQAVAAEYFGKVKEGTNKADTDDYELTLTHKITRTIDEATLTPIMTGMPMQYRSVGVLIDFTPKLMLKTYRLLEPKVRKYFDQTLVIKEGTPTLVALEKGGQ